MKKKIALLLAVVMTLALLPTNVFAATQSQVIYRASSSRGSTLLIENGATVPGGTMYYGETIGKLSTKVFDREYVKAAPELLVEFVGGATSGDQFIIQLEGAKKWAMKEGDKYSDGAYDVINDAIGAYRPQSSVQTTFTNYRGGGIYARKGSSATTTFDSSWAAYQGLGHASPEGFFDTTVGAININNYLASTYSATGTVAPYNGDREQLPYTMALTTDTTARVTILGSSAKTGNESAVVVIPLPMLVDENARVTVQVQSRTDAVTKVSTSAKILAVEGVSSAVSIKIADTISNYELFPIKKIEIQELRANSIQDGTFSISAPSGFEFVNPSDYLSSQSIVSNVPRSFVFNDLTAATAGVKNNSTGYYVDGWVWDTAVVANQYRDNVGVSAMGHWDYSAVFNWLVNYNWNLTQVGAYTYDIDLRNADGNASYVGISGGFGASTALNLDRIYFKATRNGDIDKTKAYIKFSGLDRSTVERGYLEFGDLPLLLKASANAADGDVLVNFAEEEGTEPGIKQTGVKAGNRTNWTINFTTISDTTVLYNGQYEGTSAQDDNTHKVAKMKFEENLPNSWLANRKTEFVFPEGIKISKVKISEKDKIKEAINDTYEVTGQGVYTQGYLTIEDNVISLSGITLDKYTNENDKAKFEMEVWLSIESGWEGDIEVALGGTAIPSDDQKSLKVAEARNPIEVKADSVSDIKIGYQYQSTADFTIKEARAGILRKGDTVKISLSDGIDATDMSFVDAKAEVTEGNLTFKNFKVSAYSNSSASSTALATNSSGTISFDIDKASSVASTIKFTGVQVKIDRTIPETNYTPYKLVVWGNAVANNYDATSSPRVATFTTPGIMEDYLKVATLASGNAMNSKVEVTIGTSSIKVNGVESAIDAPAFIDPTSDSTMIPVRAIAVALGIAEEFVQWDDATKTVTIYGDTRVVQFTIGSDQIIVNGVATPMTAADGSGRPVKAQINNERSFIPFRSLGNAFNVPVDWNADTQTAIFNP